MYQKNLGSKVPLLKKKAEENELNLILLDGKMDVEKQPINEK